MDIAFEEDRQGNAPVTPLTPQAYDEAEREAIESLPNRVVEAFRPVTYGAIGYPVHVDSVGELWKYADAMQEGRFESDFATLLGALTADEFTLFREMNEAVVEISTEYFGRPLVARSSLLRAISTLRHLRYIYGDQRPTILEVGPGSGYLGAMLIREGYPYVATDVAQAFYLYQHLLWSKVSRGHIRQVARSSERLKTLGQPQPGEVVHLPWWRFYDAEYKDANLEIGAVTCNHALCEMHPRSLYYFLALSKHLLRNGGGADFPAFVFEGWGSDLTNQAWYVNSRFYHYGFAMCHNDSGISIYADSNKVNHVANYPILDASNLHDSANIRRLAERRLTSLWEPVLFSIPQNELSARVQDGRRDLNRTVDVETVKAFLVDLAGEGALTTPDEEFWRSIGIS